VEPEGDQGREELRDGRKKTLVGRDEENRVKWGGAGEQEKKKEAEKKGGSAGRSGKKTGIGNWGGFNGVQKGQANARGKKKESKT